MIGLEYIKRKLREVSRIYPFRDSESLKEAIQKHKESAISDGDQALAKEIWCLEQILKIQDNYIIGFARLKSGDYYNGWCSFAESEKQLKFLSPHYDFKNDDFQISFMNEKINQLQSLFPYLWFTSPEYLVKKEICSTCGQEISLRNPCGHKIGEVYNGEMCYRIVKDVEFVGLSLVRAPVNKYSVINIYVDEKSDKLHDSYNYYLVSYVVKLLPSPFYDWRVEWTKKAYQHSAFPNLTSEDRCPCGSGKSYGECCQNKPEVIIPHCDIHLLDPVN